MSRGSASAQTMEAEPPDMRYQALPGNEYNHLGLLYQQIIADLRFAPIIKLSVPQKPAFVVGCKKESFGNQVSQGDDNNLKFRVSACLESKFGKYLEPKQEISRATLTDYQY